MLSQNGWSVATAADIHYYQLVGGKVGLRKGSVATVMLALAGDLQKLERAVWPGIWGWYVRPIRGQTSGYSNHASGTAMDWNAPAHPRQSRSRYQGWSTSQVKAIHALLAGKYQGVLRWGGDYVSQPYDPMHFEINATPARVALLAAALTKPPVSHSSVYFNPETSEDGMFLAREKSSSAVYLVWPGYRSWIQKQSILGAWQAYLKAKGLNDQVLEVPDGDLAGITTVGTPHA